MPKLLGLELRWEAWLEVFPEKRDEPAARASAWGLRSGEIGREVQSLRGMDNREPQIPVRPPYAPVGGRAVIATVYGDLFATLIVTCQSLGHHDPGDLEPQTFHGAREDCGP